MKYGYFDDANREYVVDRPDTPRAWSNYSGSRKYGAIITNNAGGYSFFESPARGRFLRLRFNSVPMDQPGRYFYLRDADSGDYWSSSWQPVGKPLDRFRSICRFGTGYTVIESDYEEIHSEATYFVPVDKAFEYWRLRVTNRSERARRLNVLTYCEFASEWNIFQDGFNLQYSAYTIEARRPEANILELSQNRHVPVRDRADGADHGACERWCWMSLSGADVVSFETSREAFLGPYRTYQNPIAVETGELGGGLAYGDNACGGMRADLDLAPGETRELVVLLGVGKAQTARAVTSRYACPQIVERELQAVKQRWHSYLDNLRVETPDADFDHMVNVWNAYNALMTYEWSRACSLVYTGDQRDGFGFRDTVQDILGAATIMGADVEERLTLMLSAQESHGGGQPEVDPTHHRPGSMPPTPAEKLRADDCLWFFNTVPAYLAETGNLAFLDKVVPFADAGEATVFGHLRRALDFNLERLGSHALPCGLKADWNDCLVLGPKGETTFVAFQLRFGLQVYARLADLVGQPAEAAWAREVCDSLDAVIQEHCWDGGWFIRAYREDGTVIGSAGNEEGSIFLNPQSWSVISGAASPEQAERAMDSVEELLATEWGIPVCTPPFRKTEHNVVRAVLLNPGQKENGGIFSHPQGWAVMADCMLGLGDRAYEHYRAYMPSAQNDRIEVREIEPFVHCQSTDAPDSPRHGLSHIPWLSGTASWSYYTATHYILGVRPEVDGLRIDPCIPSHWPSFAMRRRWRGRTLSIRVENPDRVSHGVESIRVNGQDVATDLIPLSMLPDGAEVVVTLSRAACCPPHQRYEAQHHATPRAEVSSIGA